MLLMVRRLLDPVVKSSPSHHRCLVTGKPFFKSRRSSAEAIKQASSSSPRDGLGIYCRMHRQFSVKKLDSYALLFVLKSAATMKDPRIVRHFHAHVVRVGFGGNVYIATCLLSAYVAASFRDARLLFDEMPDRTAVTWNVMITGYARFGDVDKALDMFEEMPERNVESWSAMITAFVHSGRWAEGLFLFREMMMAGNDGPMIMPDKITLSTVLSCCAQMGCPGSLLGRSVHGYLLKMNGEIDNVLVDMYAKCGVFKYACLVFSAMKEKNVIAWTALISGAARHGCSEEALSLFEMMKEEGVRPNEMTFTGVLHACAHTGMVGAGQRYFNMIEEYGLEYKIQHYGCMVDIYGRAGLVEEARGVIERMKLEPNAAVWGSFLSACKEHNRFDMAEKVIEQVLAVIKPETDGGVYTQICDLFVLDEKWEDAERVRKLMLNQNVRKVRGSSFVRSRVDRGYS
ncbi:unnamed protein product [Linum trigynum]|uniref:Uncharacterized protein n=1 Tax=Linum trigynum TaxID=586398 RepID=A0AAV2DHR3_9ROSI